MNYDCRMEGQNSLQTENKSKIIPIPVFTCAISILKFGMIIIRSINFIADSTSVSQILRINDY